MDTIQNYAPFIQLAVAFNFAFVAFGSNRAEQRIIEKLKTPFDKKQQKLEEYIEAARSDLNQGASDIYQNPWLKKVYMLQSASYKKRAENAKKRVGQIKQLHPCYMGPVSLITGVYSIAWLLLLGEMQQQDALKNVYIFFTGCIFVTILVYLWREAVKNRKIWKYTEDAQKKQEIETEEKEYIRPLIILLGCQLGYLWLIGRLPALTTYVCGVIDYQMVFRYALLLPYISFIVCFLFFLLLFGISFFYKCYVIFCKWRYNLTYKLKSRVITWLMWDNGQYADMKTQPSMDLDEVYHPEEPEIIAEPDNCEEPATGNSFTESREPTKSIVPPDDDFSVTNRPLARGGKASMNGNTDESDDLGGHSHPDSVSKDNPTRRPRKKKPIAAAKKYYEQKTKKK